MREVLKSSLKEEYSVSLHDNNTAGKLQLWAEGRRVYMTFVGRQVV